MASRQPRKRFPVIRSARKPDICSHPAQEPGAVPVLFGEGSLSKLCGGEKPTRVLRQCHIWGYSQVGRHWTLTPVSFVRSKLPLPDGPLARRSSRPLIRGWSRFDSCMGYHMRDFRTGIATAARFDSSVTHNPACHNGLGASCGRAACNAGWEPKARWSSGEDTALSRR